MITPGVRALVWLDLRDQVRDRKAMFARAMPVLFVLIGVAFGAATASTGDNAQQDLRRVAVTGAVAQRTGLVELGPRSGIDVAVRSDPRTAVAAGDAEAGVVGPAEKIEILHRSGNADSALTARRVRVALLEASGGPQRAVTIEEVEGDISKLRKVLAAVLPPMLIGLLGVAFGSCAAQFQSARRSGTLAHQLTLPLPRSQLLIAKTLTEATLTGVALSPFLILIIAVIGASVGASSGAGAAAAAVATALLVVVAVLATSGLTGLIVAARSSRLAAASSIGFVPYGLALALSGFYIIAEHEVPLVFVFVPVVGLLDVLRRAMLTGLDPVLLLVAATVTTAATVALLRVGADAAAADDLGMRVQ